MDVSPLNENNVIINETITGNKITSLLFINIYALLVARVVIHNNIIIIILNAPFITMFVTASASFVEAAAAAVTESTRHSVSYEIYCRLIGH